MNTIWLALMRTVSPSGRCRSIQPFIVIPFGDETGILEPAVLKSRANTARLANISAPANSATRATMIFVGMAMLSFAAIMQKPHPEDLEDVILFHVTDGKMDTETV